MAFQSRLAVKTAGEKCKLLHWLRMKKRLISLNANLMALSAAGPALNYLRKQLIRMMNYRAE